MTREEFLATVERHLADSGEYAANFGTRAVGDPSFVFDLRKGRTVNLDIVERVSAAIADPTYRHRKKSDSGDAATPAEPASEAA